MNYLSSLLALFLVLGSAHGASAQSDYPKSPIRFINTSSAGGASDIFMRALIDELQKTIKQSMFIENRPGGGFNISARACAEAAPDGYTFCVLPGEVFIYNPHLFKNLSYDPSASFEPILTLFILPQVLAVRSDLNVKTIDDLARLSRAKPKTLSYASPGISQFVFVENYINKEKGGDLVRVPFRGGGDVVNGIMTGTTPIAFIGISNLLGLFENKDVVGLVVDTRRRLAQLPDVPTFHEAGFKGDITTPFFALAAPAKTPAAIVGLIRTEIQRVIADPEFRRRNFTERGLVVPDDPEDEIHRLLATQRSAGERIFQDSGLKPQ